MSNLWLPAQSDLALALREPNLLVPGRKPVGRVKIKDEWLSKGLKLALSGMTQNPMNAVNGDQFQLGGSCVYVPGVGYYSPGGSASDIINLGSPAYARGDRDFSIFTVAQLFNPSPNDLPAIVGRGDTGGGEWMLRAYRTGNGYSFYADGFNFGYFGSLTYSEKRFGVSVSPSALDQNVVNCYVDGNNVYTFAANWASTTAKDITIFGADGAGTRTWKGWLNLLYIFDSFLTDYDHFRLYSDPYQVFEPANSTPFGLTLVGGGGAITGNLAAQETGSDSASITGTVAVTGTLAAQETGADAAALTGAVIVSGTLSAQESGSDTAAFSGQAPVTITGTLAAQEVGSDSASMTGALLVAGTLTVQETGSDTAAMTGAVIPVGGGYLSAQESGTDTAAITGTVHVSGILQAVETGADTAAFSGTAPVTVTGTLEVREAGTDSAALLGAVRIVGTLAAVETGADSASFRKTLTGVGSMAAQETGSDTARFGGFAGTATGREIAQEIAMTRTIYNMLGQSVIYRGATQIVHCKIIINNQDEATGFDVQSIGGDVSARIQVADLAQPERGDVIATRQGTEHVVDQYQRLNWAEWSLELRTNG